MICFRRVSCVSTSSRTKSIYSRSKHQIFSTKIDTATADHTNNLLCIFIKAFMRFKSGINFVDVCIVSKFNDSKNNCDDEDLHEKIIREKLANTTLANRIAKKKKLHSFYFLLYKCVYLYI